MFEVALTIYAVKTFIGLVIAGIAAIIALVCFIHLVYENWAYLRWRSKQKKQWRKKNNAEESDKMQSE